MRSGTERALQVLELMAARNELVVAARDMLASFDNYPEPFQKLIKERSPEFLPALHAVAAWDLEDA